MNICGTCKFSKNGKYDMPCLDCEFEPGKTPTMYEPQVITHIDRIRAMSAANLAEFLAQIMDNCWNAGRCGECDEECPMYECCNDQSSDNVEEWLKQEVQDD